MVMDAAAGATNWVFYRVIITRFIAKLSGGSAILVKLQGSLCTVGIAIKKNTSRVGFITFKTEEGKMRGADKRIPH